MPFSDKGGGLKRKQVAQMCTYAGEAEEGYGGQRRTLSGGIFAEVSADNPGHNLRLSGVQVHQCGEKIVAGREEEGGSDERRGA